MRPPRRFRRSVLPAVALLAASVVATGCATSRQTVTSSAAAAGMSAAPVKLPAAGAANEAKELPREIPLRLRLSTGQTWKSRIVSTSDVRWQLRGADGKTAVRSKVMGIEIVATQAVTGMSGTVATVEVAESSVRILREGTFVDAPFRQFDPPAKFAFTVDTETGKTDFGAMKKAYADWMARVKEGPAGEILGRTFRVEDYVAQLEDLYGKPFSRFAGLVLGSEGRTVEEKEFLLPFAGPGTSIPPIPVTWTIRSEGMEVRGAARNLKVAGTFGSGPVERTSEEETARMFAEFARTVPPGTRRTGEARGQARSTVDLLSGRERGTDRRFTYATTATFDGGALSGVVAGRLLVEPVE